MRVRTTVEAMRAAARVARLGGLRVGLVPTMGALHEGHLSLVRAAKSQCEAVVVSIFVNPLQFGPNEDLAKYPRTFERDCELLRKEDVDSVFAPAVGEIYAEKATTYVTVEGLSEKLCGRSRPGHFRGVTTVVAKLFNIVQPHLAFFGQKDAAQVAIIRRMARDLDVGIEIIACPIVREPDGLAMSSRNEYLSLEERKFAVALYRALQELRKKLGDGERNTARLIASGKKILMQQPEVQLDYLEIVDPDTLDAVEEVKHPALAAVAAFVGKTRLIDNVLLSP
jgi:pantoate--beta-alanine ligase